MVRQFGKGLFVSFAARTLSAAAVGGGGANAGTLDAGYAGDGTGYGYYTGYGVGFGSISSSFFTDGKQIVAIYDYSIPAVGYDSANLVIGGFGSDPGQTGYFTSFTAGLNTKSAASATAYFYNSGTGQATWVWGASGAPQYWDMTYGVTYSWSKA